RLPFFATMTEKRATLVEHARWIDRSMTLNRLVHALVLAVLTLAPLAICGGALAEGEADFLAGRAKTCRNCSLPNAPFKRKDLSGADLTGAKMTAAVMHRARLLRTIFTDADLTNANLNKTDLKGASLARAKLDEAMFYESDASGSDFTGAALAGAKMQR